MPKGTPIDWIPHRDLLTDGEIERLVRVAVGLGVKKIRITGGEPLVRKGVVDLIGNIATIPGIEDLALSTNGLLLDRYAGELKKAGLMRLNISLDTIDPQKFEEMTGGGKVESVLSGIQAAKQAGFWPIKINTVVIREKNDTEIETLLDFAEREGLILRFIEYMPLCSRGNWGQGFISCQEILERIRGRLQLDQEAAASDPGEPARYFRLKNGQGMVGVISPISNSFCSRCNRLRLTADGMLRVCLPSDVEVDLKTPLRNGATDAQLAQLFVQGARLKPERGEFVGVGNRTMIQIGG
jgi:cyclic pyranopterin phosphate synthase